MSSDPTDPATSRTPYNNFLCLLSEIEQALERGAIVWPPGGAKAAQRRVALLFVQLDAIINRPPPASPPRP
jgi:hypothetical protein